MIFAASIIDKITSLRSGIAMSDDLGYIGELEGTNHSVSPNDSVAGSRQLQHGSFDLVPTTHSIHAETISQTTSDALNEAPSAHLTQEEATLYLKNSLGMEPTTTSEKSTNANDGDARHYANNVTHGRPWKMVTRRHHTLRNISAELGPPSVEGSYASHYNWKAKPGLYGFTLKNKHRLAPNGHSTPATKKSKKKKGYYYRKTTQRKSNYIQDELDFRYFQRRNMKMPP
jgi:hypothetical protein